MARLILFSATAVFLIGCGGNVEASCADYVAAATSCVETAWGTDTAGALAQTSQFDGLCEENYLDLTASEAKDAVSILDCYTEAYAAGDCTTYEGYTAIGVEVVNCTP